MLILAIGRRFGAAVSLRRGRIAWRQPATQGGGLLFKDGPSGRRAALAFGPDIWEVVKVLKEVDERGASAVEAVAEIFALPETRIRAAMRYYAAHPAEIDAEIDAADAASSAAEVAWHAEQRLLT